MWSSGLARTDLDANAADAHPRPRQSDSRWPRTSRSCARSAAHLLLPSLAMAGLLLVVLPVLVIVAFQRSERATRDWVVAGLDLDIELLNLIASDLFEMTRVGKYLDSLKARFPPHVVVDMYCLLRVELELAIQAKGLVLAAEAGLNAPVHPDADAALAEVDCVRRSIGRTGLLALGPLHVSSDRDAWHRHVLARGHRRGVR